MKISMQLKLSNTKNYYNYLKDNSLFIKELNRSEINYKLFDEYVKNKYTLKLGDRLNKALNNIENVSSFLNLLK